MKVIFGEENITDVIKERFIVLELDTFNITEIKKMVTCYGVIGADEISIDNFSDINSMRDLHQRLVDNFKEQNWNFCEQAIDHLINFWPKGYEEFYTNMLDKITDYKKNPPDENWTPVIDKY